MYLQIIQNVIKLEYDIEGDISLYRESDDNLLYTLKSADGDYAVRISKHASLPEVRTEGEIIALLQQCNVPCASFLMSKSGSRVVLIESKSVVVMKWLSGTVITLDKNTWPSLEIIANAGEELAMFHKAVQMLNVEELRERDMFTEIVKFLSYEEMILKKTKNGIEILDQLKKVVSFAQQHTNHYQLIHNDYRPSNVMNKGSNITGILDFDWACYGHPMKDFALSLMEWSYPDGADDVNHDAFHSFLNGYERIISIDRKILNDWMLFAGLSDACTYWSNNVLPVMKLGECVELKSFMYKKGLFFHNYKI